MKITNLISLLRKNQHFEWTDVDENGKPVLRIKNDTIYSKTAVITFGGYEMKNIYSIHIDIGVGAPVKTNITFYDVRLDTIIDEQSVTVTEIDIPKKTEQTK